MKIDLYLLSTNNEYFRTLFISLILHKNTYSNVPNVEFLV